MLKSEMEMHTMTKSNNLQSYWHVLIWWHFYFSNFNQAKCKTKS